MLHIGLSLEPGHDSMDGGGGSRDEFVRGDWSLKHGLEMTDASFGISLTMGLPQARALVCQKQSP